MEAFVIFAESWFLDVGNLLSLAKAILGLGVVIFVHELGHFLVAKACGVKCEKFYIGFDVPISLGPIKLPAKLWHKQWGETEYGLGIVPLGGYVKMLGQDDNPANAAAEAERIRQAKKEADGGDAFELDPRSYPAKSVPQRMAIISAGVIMNLIFAVIFGAVAYGIGAKYQPAICGQTVPGDSAWKNGLAFGDKIVQFSREGRRDEAFRFRDIQFHIGQANDERTLEVKIQRTDGEESWVALQSVIHGEENLGLPTIGFIGKRSTKIALSTVDTWTAAAKSGIQDSDVVRRVTVDGQSFDVDHELAMRRLLMQFPDRPMQLTVDRRVEPGSEDSDSLEISLPPVPLIDFGFTLEMGQVTAVQVDSPAAKAGIQPGDTLLRLNDEPIADPLRVDEQVAPLMGTSLSLTVLRGGKPLTLSLTPREPQMRGEAFTIGRATSAETLGVAFNVLDVVAAVDPDGAAAAGGLRVGDRITAVVTRRTEATPLDEATFQRIKLHEPTVFNVEKNGWAGYLPSVHRRFPPHLDFVLAVERAGASQDVVLQPQVSEVAFSTERGLWFYGASEIRQAESFVDAWRLGFRETKEGLGLVLVTLKRFNKLHQNFGGPLSLATVATLEASQGLPRLLLFLTLLSANLAILNFLPIPVLDGGHMMFLAYEGVFGRPVPEKLAFVATMMGLCFVLGLMIYVFGLDIQRFMEWTS